jgi:hypothetical protein
MNRKLALRAATLGVVAIAIGVAGVASGAEPTASSTAGAPPTTALQQIEKPVTIEQQRGIVIEGTAVLNGEPVGISLYENEQYGNVLQVFFPESDEVGALEQEAPFVVDGRVDVTVDVDGRRARLAGVVTETGATKVVEPLQDGGEQQISKGTHYVLDAELALTVGRYSVPLETDAFAFDLDVRHVQLYGN